jgi:predicted metallo-beta-lactamase superfamily hydrolase
MPKILMLGTESLGVRGLSCFVEHKGIRVLIDPGVALGFTRWGFHPHPIQAVAGDIVRDKIKKLWKEADYVILSHMHGDHVPLYDANPFQLSLYSLEDNGKLTILAPNPETLSGRSRRRLEKIVEVYGNRVKFFNGEHLEIGPIKVYGPFFHGMSSKTRVYATFIDLGMKVLHLSDTELLCNKVIELAETLRPDVIITDGPPIYRFLGRGDVVNLMLRSASKNLMRLSKVAHYVIVDHHINRCDEGYKWIKDIAGTQRETVITTAAEYMGFKPLLLEAWRRTLYNYFPVSKDWFMNEYKILLERYRPVYYKIAKEINSYKGLVSEDVLEKLLIKSLQS